MIYQCQKNRKRVTVPAPDVQQQVQRLLGWTELEYADFQYEQGIAYLQAYIPNDQHGIDILLREKIYWNWWKNHWAIRDQDFIDVADDGTSCSHKTLCNLYRKFHSVKLLVDTIFPNAVVLGESYAKMIGQIQDAK